MKKSNLIKASGGGCAIECEKIKEPNEYRFVIEKDGFAETACGDISEILLKLYWSKAISEDEQLFETVATAIINSAMQNGDLYLAYAAKECFASITQPEADYLYSVDGNPRFIPQHKVYGTGDIEINAVHSVFHPRRVCFGCDVTINGLQYNARWYPRDTKFDTTTVRAIGIPDLLAVYSHKVKRSIRISGDLIARIEELIGKSEDK